MDEYLLHSSSKVRQIQVRFENMQVSAIKAGPNTAPVKKVWTNEKGGGLKVLSFNKSCF
jgi:hypothetical protein